MLYIFYNYNICNFIWLDMNNWSMGEFLGKGQIDSIVGIYVPWVPSGTQYLGSFIFLVLAFFYGA